MNSGRSKVHLSLFLIINKQNPSNMEQNLNEYNSANSDAIISIPQESIHFFKETGKWAKLLAILGFVFIGFMIIAAFTMGTFMAAFGGEETFAFQGLVMGLIYLVMAGLYFFPVLYLYKFSTSIKQTFVNMDAACFNTAIGNLKSHYKYIGVFTVIIMAFYAMILLGAILMAIAF